MIIRFIIFISLINISSSVFSQNNELRSTEIKIQRLLFLIEQMYVEDVNINKVQNDLVLGMYNYLRPMSLYQHDSVFHLLELKPSGKTSLGMTVKFNKGRILIDSIFSNSGAFNAQLKNKDQIIGIDNNKLNEVYYYSDFYSLSLGDENSISNLTLIREKDTFNIDVKRLKIPNHSVIPIPNSLNLPRYYY